MYSNYYSASNKAYAEHCWWVVAQEDNDKTNKVIMEIQISCRIFSFFIIINVLIWEFYEKKERKLLKIIMR